MLELTDKRLVSLLWMLNPKNRGRTWSIFELQKGAAAIVGADHHVYKRNNRLPIIDLALTYNPTLIFVKDLAKKGFLTKDSKTSEYRVTKASDLIKWISLTRPFAGLPTSDYHSPLDFTATLKLVKDAKVDHDAKLDYAFTAFAGGELYHPHVKTDQVHVYVRESDREKWKTFLYANKCRRADKSQGNLFLLPTEQEAFFRQAGTVKGFSVVPAPILLSDLLSLGGLAEEQGRMLLEEWLDNRM